MGFAFQLTQLPQVITDTLRSAGVPMDESVRDKMEVTLGSAFSSVWEDGRSICAVENQWLVGQPAAAFEEQAKQMAHDATQAFRNGCRGRRHKLHDFSQVKIHADEQAAKAAAALGARAFTAGQHIVFAADQYAPHTEAGYRLLAHELTHVLQQGGRFTRVIQCAETDTSLGGKLPDASAAVNAEINRVLKIGRIKKPVTAAAVIKAINDNLAVNGSIGRSKIEDWIEKQTKLIHMPSKVNTKYRGVLYRLWRAASLGGFPILNPTVNINGIRIGSDKLGHFLQQGLQYYEEFKKHPTAAAGEKAAVTFGVGTEVGGFGLRTTGVYSNADLAANKAGLKFFQDLAANPNLTFDIKNYITKAWNEVHNPNYYEPAVGQIVWQNILAGKWTGAIQGLRASTRTAISITLRFAGGRLKGEFSYTDSAKKAITGIIDGTVATVLDKATMAVKGVRIDYAWTDSKPTNGKGYWESTSESALAGKYGFGTSDTSGGTWTLSKK